MTALPRVERAWYIACESKRLGRLPHKLQLLGQSLVVFRDQHGGAHALLDRCAHRNVPLSLGRVRSDDGALQCAYHGWRYDGAGRCVGVPALCGTAEGKGRKVSSFATREEQGFVWVWAQPDGTPSSNPYVFPYINDPRYEMVRYTCDFEGTLFCTAENILDVPHTAYLHRGLFRSGEKHRIRARVRRDAAQVEVEYIGEPRPTGIVGRMLAPGGGAVSHWDRFILPSIAQVEYRLGEQSHLVINDFLTPADDFLTRMHSVVAVRLPYGLARAARVLKPLVETILRQDARILRLQSQITRVHGEQFVSTEVDVLGADILRLLRHAERGETPPEAEERELELYV